MNHCVYKYNTKIYLIPGFILSLLIIAGPAASQVRNPLDSLSKSAPADTIRPIVTDTLLQGPDSLRIDLSEVNIAEAGLDAPVEYEAQDSMVYDIVNEQIHLYGNAIVKYNSLTLTAEYIIFNWGDNTVIAQTLPDSLGKITTLPKFEDKDQNFTAKKMRYNFKSGKGIVYDVNTTQSNLFVLGQKAKFTSKDSLKGRPDDIVYSQNALFTSCDHPEPHYGIRSKKQKLIPNKLIVVGPSNLEIAGIPTPLWLPFGFFPVTEKRNKGLLFPKDYEFSPTFGFGLRNVGYYTPLGEYMDLTLTGDIYFNGTWGLQAAARFNKRYKFNGNFGIGYSFRKEEIIGSLNSRNTQSWSIRGSLNQSSQAHPTITIGGSINIQTNNYNSLNNNDAQSVLTQQYSSNFNFRKRFPGKPFSFSASMSHSQNVRTGDINIRLPVIDFQTETINPFKSRNRSGSAREKWYEKFTLRYRFNAQNQLSTKDSLLFTKRTLEEAEFGARHDIDAGASFRILKYFNFTPSTRYQEFWYFRSFRQQFLPEPLVVVDTIRNADGSIFELRTDTTAFGRLDTLQQFGFQPVRQYNVSASLSTQLFGTMQFRKGFIRGLRHVIKPNLSFGYTPDYTAPRLGYYDTIIDGRDGTEEELFYSVFENPIYGRPSASGPQLGFSYGITNNFEAKYFSKKDSTEKKIRLFDAINVRGSYNAVADSLKWSDVSANGTTRFFDNMSTVSFTASWSPYEADFSKSTTGRKINTFVWNTRRRPLRFVQASFRLSNNLSVKKLRELFGRKDKATPEEEPDPDADPFQDSAFDDIQDEEEDPNDPRNLFRNDLNAKPKPVERAPEEEKKTSEYRDFFALFDDFRISHDFNLNLQNLQEKDTLIVTTHTIRFQGRISLSDNWNITLGGIGYDFKSKRITYPDIRLSRNLHCWDMSFAWQPTRRTFSFNIRVSSGPLNFLKLPYQRNNVDSRAFRF